MATEYLPIDNNTHLVDELSNTYYSKLDPSPVSGKTYDFWTKLDNLGIALNLRNYESSSQHLLKNRRRTILVRPEDFENYEIITTPFTEYGYKKTKAGEVYYSPRFQDDKYIYRYVALTSSVKKEAYRLSKMQLSNLLTEEQIMDGLGIEMSRGWEHFMLYRNRFEELILRRPRYPTKSK